MCGICGIAYADHNRPVEPALLKSMSDSIRHRGPDSDGFHFAPGIGLAARRLAIIDVAGGDQPLSNEDGTVHVVFNGEIYNHVQLRDDLERRGHRFRSHVDTETIVHLYEEHGADCVRHLRGMFAFALWDARARKLLLARDRVGKKPLYYAAHDGGLIFGSELKCLLRYPGIAREPDLDALYHFLSLQYVPEPLSAIAGVHKLPPASRLTWQDRRFDVQRYWDLEFEPKQKLTYEDARVRVRDEVTEAVRIRLMSEVPLGAHLSGGIDSAVVVGVMAGLMSRPVSTFTVGFRESAFDETSHARRIAQRFSTDHHELIVEPLALDILPDLVAHFDEPFADAAAIPLWYLSCFTRRHVTVALNGDGGDEAFAGYQRYYADPIADAYRWVPARARTLVFDRVLGALPVRHDLPIERSYTAALRLLTRAARVSHGASVLRWGSYFDENEKRALLRPDIWTAIDATPTPQLLEATYREAIANNRIDRTLYTDVRNYLPGALLVKADRMTMAHSLEARSPLLDHQLLELAATLPVDYKLKGRRGKRILRDAFAHLLPADLAARPKMGFGVPLAEWFRGPLRDGAREILLARDARVSEYLRQEPIEQLFTEHAARTADHGKRLWALLNLETWLRYIARDA